jgi:hypothetical protein
MKSLFCVAMALLGVSASCGARVTHHSSTRDAKGTSDQCELQGTGTMVIPTCTPGDGATVNEHIACTAALHPRTEPSTLLRHRVFRTYHVPYSQHDLYEVDHRIPVFLRGKTDIKNLWPERNQAHEVGFIHNPKDALEQYVYRHVCSNHDMTVDQALDIFNGDWREAYQQYHIGDS